LVQTLKLKETDRRFGQPGEPFGDGSVEILDLFVANRLAIKL